jgi:hypothetical protein
MSKAWKQCSSDDSAVVDLDPRPELVREPEPVGRAEGLEIVDPVRRRFVVVGHPEVEGELHGAAHRLGRDPGERHDLPFDAHAVIIGCRMSQGEGGGARSAVVLSRTRPTGAGRS